MRHQKAGRKLGRNSAHRKAMFSNLVTSLIVHERIETTEPKAKEIRRLADRTIGWAVSVADLSTKDHAKLSPEDRARLVHAIRMAKRSLKEQTIVGDSTERSDTVLKKLFSEVAPAFHGRRGGFTRLLKTRNRVGDGAAMTFVELVARPERAQSVAEASAGEGKSSTAASSGKRKSDKPSKTKE